MKILYIDTSTNYLYTAIVENEKLLYQTKNLYNNDLSKYTIFEIQKMFEYLNLQPNDIDKILVVSGPGSFTGIRIGMTFAKIFAWSLKKDIITITSLEAMNASYESSKLTIPLIDARHNYVYAGIYKDNKNIFSDQYIKLEDLKQKIQELNEDYIIITNSDLNLENKIKYNPDILKIVEQFKNRKATNPHNVAPDYLKLTEAEEKLGNNNYANDNINN